jgi:hypothetical protein
MSTAASPPAAAARAQPIVVIRVTLTPSSRDTSGANADARSRSPNRVLENSRARDATRRVTAAKTNNWYGDTVFVSPTVSTVAENGVPIGRYSEP